METFGIRIYKEYFNFAAAHFLIFEDGTREELHGHNYHVSMSIEGTLDETQDVFIDFLHIKPIVKRMCDTIDHRTLLPQFSRMLQIEDKGNEVEARFDTNDRWVFPRRDVVILPITNTSAERLAEYLCKQTLEALAEQYPNAAIRQVEFSVEESKGQCAVFRMQFENQKPLSEIVASQTLATC